MPASYALIAHEQRYVTDPGCTEDHEHSWCEQECTSVSVTPVTLHATRRDFYRTGYELIEAGDYNVVYDVEVVPVGDMAYVVIATYTDGGTFGYDGYWCVAGLSATPEGAEAMLKRAEGPNDTQRYFRPWDGYFASLDDVEVHPMVVLL